MEERIEDTPPSLALEIGVIALGGALGAGLRFAATLAVSTLRTVGHADFNAAWATFLVNIVGAFGLGLLLAGIEDAASPPLLRPFWVMGVFGSFTTFSALAFDNRLLATRHGEWVALAHVAISMGVGLAFFALGTWAGRQRS